VTVSSHIMKKSFSAVAASSGALHIGAGRRRQKWRKDDTEPALFTNSQGFVNQPHNKRMLLRVSTQCFVLSTVEGLKVSPSTGSG
jgi:hypothetical protein